MAYTLDDIQKLVKVLEQITSFMSANIPDNETTYEQALLFLLNKGVGTIVGGDIAYDNSISGLAATNIQDAIDELDLIIKGLQASDISVIPSGSLTDLNVQDALVSIYSRTDVVETRLDNIENAYVKATFFEIISTPSGTITIPAGGEILLDELNGEVDALVSEIDGSNTPTWEEARDAAGDIISVSSFTTAGAYVLDRTPTGPVALIYVYRVKRIDYDHTKALAIGFETIELTTDDIKDLYPRQVIITGDRNANNTNNQYLRHGGNNIAMNLVGYTLPFDATLVGIISRTVNNETWIAEVRKNGLIAPEASLSITATDFEEGQYSILFDKDDEIQIYANGTSISRPKVTLIFEER